MYILYLASHVDHVFKSLVEVIADLKNRRQNHDNQLMTWQWHVFLSMKRNCWFHLFDFILLSQKVLLNLRQGLNITDIIARTTKPDQSWRSIAGCSSQPALHDTRSSSACRASPRSPPASSPPSGSSSPPQPNVLLLRIYLGKLQPQLRFVSTITTGGDVPFASWCTFLQREHQILAYLSPFRPIFDILRISWCTLYRPKYCGGVQKSTNMR